MDWSIEKVNQKGKNCTFIFWIFLLAKQLWIPINTSYLTIRTGTDSRIRKAKKIENRKAKFLTGRPNKYV